MHSVALAVERVKSLIDASNIGRYQRLAKLDSY